MPQKSAPWHFFRALSTGWICWHQCSADPQLLQLIVHVIGMQILLPIERASVSGHLASMPLSCQLSLILFSASRLRFEMPSNLAWRMIGACWLHLASVAESNLEGVVYIQRVGVYNTAQGSKKLVRRSALWCSYIIVRCHRVHPNLSISDSAIVFQSFAPSLRSTANLFLVPYLRLLMQSVRSKDSKLRQRSAQSCPWLGLHIN